DGSLTPPERDVFLAGIADDASRRSDLGSAAALLDAIEAEPRAVPAGLVAKAAAVLAPAGTPVAQKVSEQPQYSWWQGRRLAWASVAGVLVVAAVVPSVRMIDRNKASLPVVPNAQLSLPVQSADAKREVAAGAVQRETTVAIKPVPVPTAVPSNDEQKQASDSIPSSDDRKDALASVRSVPMPTTVPSSSEHRQAAVPVQSVPLATPKPLTVDQQEVSVPDAKQQPESEKTRREIAVTVQPKQQTESATARHEVAVTPPAKQKAESESSLVRRANVGTLKSAARTGRAADDPACD